MARKILLFGATSAIAQETAKLLHADGDRLFLVARDARKLEIVAGDLALRGPAEVDRLVADLDDVGRHREIYDAATAALDGLDAVILAHGVLGDAEACHTDFDAASRVFRTNLTSAVSLLTLAAERFEGQGRGSIVALSSVAGDRGRQSNYVYGASKGALTLFLQGLRNRLDPKGIHVLTVKPGMVDSPMTDHMEKGLLFSTPSAVARGIHRALRRRKDVVYVPGYWRWIMGVITHIPETIFKRLRL